MALASVSIAGTEYDYTSSYILKDKTNTDSKGFNIIEDIAHYIAGFPVKINEGFITIDLTDQRYDDFQQLMQNYSNQDIQFALLSLGLIKEIDTKWSLKEAHVLIATALSFANEKYKQPSATPLVTHEPSDQTVMMTTPDDAATLDMVSYTYDFANKLSDQTTVNIIKPIDYFVQERLVEYKDFEVLRNSLTASGINVVLIDGYKNGHQDYEETDICRTVFVTPNEAVFADYSNNQKKRYLQSQSSNLQDALQARGIKSFALTDVSFDGMKIQDGEKVIWILWNGEEKIPHELADKLKEITGKILVPVILKTGTKTVPFRELPHGEILYKPADLDEKFIIRLKKTYSGAFAEKLIEVTNSKTSLDLIAIGNEIFAQDIDEQTIKALTERGYKLYKVSTSTPNYLLSCKALQIK